MLRTPNKTLNPTPVAWSDSRVQRFASGRRRRANPFGLRRRAVEINLDAGLWLEDRCAYLPWGSTLDDLRATARPDLWTVSGESPPADRVAWNARVWGGLRCQVATSLGGPHQAQTLRGVRLVFWRPAGIRSCPESFRWLQAELAERFGPPGSITDDGLSGKALWRVGQVTVRHEYLDFIGGGHFVFVFPSNPESEPIAAANGEDVS